MPWKPPHPCSYPGCEVLTTERRCADHMRVLSKNRRPTRRFHGTQQWRRCRNAYIKAHPICEMLIKCQGDPASEVDHIVPIEDGGAPLDWENLQSGCKPCHSSKTYHIDKKGIAIT